MEAINVFYLAKPRYGGWVTFTVHLIYKLIQQGYKVNLYKVGKKTETKPRPFGYGLNYINVSEKMLLKSHKGIITALDKNYYDVVNRLSNKHKLVVHDPTEVKKDLFGVFKKYELVTIRKTVQEYLQTLGFDSELIYHPFYEYDTSKSEKTGAVSISRIDYDKNIHFICKANMMLKEPILMYGYANRLYQHFKLNEIWNEDNYKGAFNKSFKEVDRILSKKKYVVDMSTIHKDGGGTQYTFLEAIHNNCILILNKKWVDAGDTFKEGGNCLVARDENDIIDILTTDKNYPDIIRNAKKLMTQHTGGIELWRE